MKTKLLSALLFICIFYSCGPDRKEIIEPEQPPIDNPERPDDTEQPNKPDIPEQPEEPQKPSKMKGIININNEYMAVGTKNWNAITYGNGKYVVVGSNMFTTTSTDGENWTTPKAIQDGSYYGLFSVAYGNEKYITFNESGYLSTSSDGINWTSPKIPISGMNSKVGGLTFINGKFIGVAMFNDNNGHAIYSTDGENWTHCKIGNGNFNVIMYGNGIYVAVNAIGNVYTSANGENWTKSTKSLSPQMTWLDGAFGNGKFVVINGQDEYIVISTDGENWTRKTVGTSHFKCITFGDGKFIATNYYLEVYTSTDGENWTKLNDLPFEANDIIFVQ